MFCTQNQFKNFCIEGNYNAVLQCLKQKDGFLNKLFGFELDVTGEMLIYACKNNHTNIAMLLVENGANINEIDYRFMETPLVEAIRRQNPALSHFLISKGANIGILEFGESIRIGNLEIVEMLLQAGAEVNLKDEEVRCNRPPLHIAIDHQNLEIVKLLIGKGAVVTQSDAKGITPGELAAQKGLKDIYGLLINCGASPVETAPVEQFHMGTGAFSKVPRVPDWLIHKLKADSKKYYLENDAPWVPYLKAVNDGFLELNEWGIDLKNSSSGSSLKENVEHWEIIMLSSLEIYKQEIEHTSEYRLVESVRQGHMAVLFSKAGIIKILEHAGLSDQYIYDPQE